MDYKKLMIFALAIFSIASAEQSFNPLCLDTEGESAIFLLLLVIVLAFSLTIVYAFHHYEIGIYIPESVCVMVVGIFCGLFIRYAIPSGIGPKVAQLDPKLFFIVFLPCIVFDAAYNCNKIHFFRNILGIFFYAIFGTLISTIVISSAMYLFGYLAFSQRMTALDCLQYGSVISATDPVATLALFSTLNVNPTLHYLVFGESIVNDALAIVLYQTFESLKQNTGGDLGLLIGSGILQFLLSFFGSILLGVVFSLLGALITKKVDMRKNVAIELSFFFLVGYIPYLVALKYLSGIMCLFTSGLVMSYYVTPNLSNESKTVLKEVTHTLSLVFEVFTFAFLGMAIFNFPTQDWDIGLIVVVSISMLIGRVLNIFPLTAIVNLFLTEKIDFKTQLFLWWSGLRGAIAVALAIDLRKEETVGGVLFTTTIAVVMLTNIVLGGATVPLLKIFKIKRADENDNKIDYDYYDDESKLSFIERMDEKYLQKIFLRSDVIRKRKKEYLKRQEEKELKKKQIKQDDNSPNESIDQDSNLIVHNEDQIDNEIDNERQSSFK
eukprot:gene12513-6261_t